MKLPDPAHHVAVLVGARLGQLFDEETQRWGAVADELAVPLDALRRYVLAGGKRLRPAFCYWSFVGAGGDRDDPLVVDAGAGLEMLHAAALVHDDVIDASIRRHGSETIHAGFAGVHSERGWAGDPRRFGEGVAILAGDLALVYSSRLLAGAPPAARAVFEEMRLEVNMGQYLDVLGAALGAAGPGAEDRARLICRYKTAKYTVERPLHLGAALAAPGRLGELAGPLSRFGLPIGEAFQLRDDLLGVFGDPGVTGKPVGDDLREGKATLLAALAAKLDPAGFAARLTRGGIGEADVARLQDSVARSGARDLVEAEIERLAAKAGAALGALALRPEALSALADLAAFAAGRDH